MTPDSVNADVDLHNPVPVPPTCTAADGPQYDFLNTFYPRGDIQTAPSVGPPGPARMRARSLLNPLVPGGSNTVARHRSAFEARGAQIPDFTASGRDLSDPHRWQTDGASVGVFRAPPPSRIAPTSSARKSSLRSRFGPLVGGLSCSRVTISDANHNDLTHTGPLGRSLAAETHRPTTD